MAYVRIRGFLDGFACSIAGRVLPWARGMRLQPMPASKGEQRKNFIFAVCGGG